MWMRRLWNQAENEPGMTRFKSSSQRGHLLELSFIWADRFFYCPFFYCYYSLDLKSCPKAQVLYFSPETGATGRPSRLYEMWPGWVPMRLPRAVGPWCPVPPPLFPGHRVDSCGLPVPCGLHILPWDPVLQYTKEPLLCKNWWFHSREASKNKIIKIRNSRYSLQSNFKCNILHISHFLSIAQLVTPKEKNTLGRPK